MPFVHGIIALLLVFHLHGINCTKSLKFSSVNIIDNNKSLIKRNPYSLHSIYLLRGGNRKKKLSLIYLIKAFWLTLIDPDNEESLKNPQKNIQKKKNEQKLKSKTKKRSLK